MRSPEEQLGQHIESDWWLQDPDGKLSKMLLADTFTAGTGFLFVLFAVFFSCGSLSWSFTKCWAVTSWLRSIQAAFGSCWDGYNLIKVHCLYSLSLMESLPAHRHLYSYEFFKIAAINGMFWHYFYCKESPFKNHCDALYTYCTFYVELFIELWEFWKTGALFVEHVFQTRSIS